MCSTDPDFYKKTPSERFVVNDDIEDIFKSWISRTCKEDEPILEKMVHDLINKSDKQSLISKANDFKIDKEMMLLRRNTKSITKRHLERPIYY